MLGSMTIGQLAKTAGVNVETIRYYQRRGLLETPGRPAGGSRRYPSNAVQRLGFIRRAQEVGFTLDEIRALLEIAEKKDCARARAILEAKHHELGRRVDELNGMRRKLRSYIRREDGGSERPTCAVIAALVGDAG